MTTKKSQPNGATDANAPHIEPNVYLKDVSYEAPNGPLISEQTVTPNVTMDVQTTINQLGPQMYEVIVGVNVRSVLNEKTLWLCEVKQAGSFILRNIAASEVQRLLSVFCPNYLWPYARQTISDLLVKGGFAPFLLPPVNFEALYEQTLAQQELLNTPAANTTVN